MPVAPSEDVANAVAISVSSPRLGSVPVLQIRCTSSLHIIRLFPHALSFEGGGVGGVFVSVLSRYCETTHRLASGFCSRLVYFVFIFLLLLLLFRLSECEILYKGILPYLYTVMLNKMYRKLTASACSPWRGVAERWQEARRPRGEYLCSWIRNPRTQIGTTLESVGGGTEFQNLQQQKQQLSLFSICLHGRVSS